MLEGGGRWKFRHELLSAAIFRACFDVQNPKMRRAYLALLTHHKNLGGDSVASLWLEAQSDARRAEYCQWFTKWRELRAKELQAEFASDLAAWKFDPNTTSPANEVRMLMDEIAPAFEDLALTLARGALVAADHLASSGLPPALSGHDLSRARLEASVQKQLQSRGVTWQKWQPMQEECAITGQTALLIAPTGSGKTEAALLWALHNRTGGERIFYVLPYQVSINAMAQRLANLFPDEKGRDKIHDNENISLLHANMNLAYLQDALDDQLPAKRAAAVAFHNKSAARKIYAPLKITTVYQLLNVFFGRKFFEVGLLELSNSLVIFDEIHAYDGHTLGLILVLLEHLQKLGARVFIMTATLPVKLKDQLCAAASITKEINLHLGDPLLQEARRDLKLLEEPLEDAFTVEKIKAAMVAKRKVAVVCNTVRKAMQMRALLAEYNPYLLHSRFTLGDRAKRERKEQIEFEMNQGRVVIATQVLEVSLDVSFDVMFSELAPADALLQRMGRLNRHGDGTTAAPFFTACGEDRGSSLIYGDDLLARTREWAKPHVERRERLDFDAARRWLEHVYPEGLAGEELERLTTVREMFARLVSNLKPMLDAPIDNPDLELTLFESLQVVPGCFERQFIELKEQGNHLEAKKLLVNVDLRAWRGASHGAQKQGLELARQLKIIDGKRERDVIFALCSYDGEAGLDLLSLNDRSDSNFF